MPYKFKNEYRDNLKSVLQSYQLVIVYYVLKHCSVSNLHIRRNYAYMVFVPNKPTVVIEVLRRCALIESCGYFIIR